MGTLPARTCGRPSHGSRNRLLRPRRLLLHVADGGGTERGEHELLRRGVRRRHGFQSLVLARLRAEALHRSGAGAPELV